MKIPLTPPAFDVLLKSVLAAKPSGEKMVQLMQHGEGPAPRNQYLHWDKLRHLAPPEGLNVEERWFAIKSARMALYRALPYTDRHDRPFRYATPDPVLKLLHQVDREASGHVPMSDQIVNQQTRDTYLVSSLIEEAITSSQLEGASTTRKVAKEMLREGRQPRTHSEQMIHNNYRAMQFIREIAKEDITPEAVRELHRIVTENTLDNPAASGRLRSDEDDIHVVDARDSVVLHTPPRAGQLRSRLEKLCRFGNEQESASFIHPVIRAILLHFMLAYDHPFADGNGRTARALFYWSMLHQGYWLTEFISISRLLKAAPSDYARAFLYTETDDNDTTYFLMHQLRTLLRAFDELHKYLAAKADEVHEIESLVRRSPRLQRQLNQRQLALLSHALRHPQSSYRIQGHRQSHNVTYDTARNDLLALAKLRLLDQTSSGRAFVFVSPPDLSGRLKRLNDG